MPILTKPVESVRPALPGRPYASWQTALGDAVRDPLELCRLLNLPADFASAAADAARDFPLFVPRGYLARIRTEDPDDPLLRQVLPIGAECSSPPGYSSDPVGDAQATLEPGLLQKYAGRALLVTTGRCAIHCRYCFRRHFPYGASPKSPDAWRPAVESLAADTTLREVILSGGDPLTLVDETLSQLVEQLAGVEHLDRLRIHTRLPIVIPERVTPELVALLTSGRLTPIFVIHANHARELDQDVVAALGRLAAAGIPLLNQAVLLRGVNDSLAAQKALCERLVNARVMPYYVHQLDRVTGAAHFFVAPERGLEIFRALRGELPGYAVPRYVQEIPGEPSKQVLM